MNESIASGQLAYAREVLRFRRALNLTSISEEPTFIERFVDPSVALSHWIPQSSRLLDIGSGMGVPGIPLLIARPDLHGVLVERRKKRAEFLRHVVRRLKLSAEVYDADIEALPPLKADVCVARAVASADALLMMCRPHIRIGGSAVFPVPRETAAATVGGWVLVSEECVDAVESQLVRCYRREEER